MKIFGTIVLITVHWQISCSYAANPPKIESENEAANSLIISSRNLEIRSNLDAEYAGTPIPASSRMRVNYKERTPAVDESPTSCLPLINPCLKKKKNVTVDGKTIRFLSREFNLEIEKFSNDIVKKLLRRSWLTFHFDNTAVVLNAYQSLQQIANPKKGKNMCGKVKEKAYACLDAVKVTVTLIEEVNDLDKRFQMMMNVSIQRGNNVIRGNDVLTMKESDSGEKRILGAVPETFMKQPGIEMVSSNVSQEIKIFTKRLSKKLGNDNPVTMHFTNAVSMLHLYEDVQTANGDADKIEKIDVKKRVDQIIKGLEAENNTFQEIVELAMDDALGTELPPFDDQSNDA